MERTNPFTQPGLWLRGNTHSHSTVSDGKLPLAERFAQYRDGGYDFLVITDHGKVSSVEEFCTPGFLAVSGSELHPDNPYGGDRYHFVAINVSAPVPYQELAPNQVIRQVREQGGLVVVCHPYWCGHSLRDLAPLEGYFAVEVYNETCEQLIGKGHSEAHWDDLLDQVGPCSGIAADDAHGVDSDVFRAWLMVRATERSVPALLRALETGSFYSTQGPELLHLDVEQGEISTGTGTRQAPVISVRCSPAQTIVFKGQRSRGSRVDAGAGPLLEGAEYPVMRGEKYVRVEVTDAQGRKAWSNPLFFD